MTIDVVIFIQSLGNGFWDFIFNLISFLGEEYIYILVLGTIYYAVDKKMGEYMAFMLFFSGIFNNVLKNIVSAQRPFEAYPDDVVNLRPETATGHSFPSGHTQNFASFLFAGSYWTKQRVILIVSWTLVVLMGLSRMYLGVHYLEDVVASIVLGLLTAYFGYKLYTKYQDNTVILHRIYLGILGVGFVFLFVFQAEDLYKSYGLMLGFTFGMMYEKNYVQFEMDVVLYKKAIRVISGLIVMLVIQVGLGIVFDMFAEEGTLALHILDLIRYALIAFIGLGIYPHVFKRFNI